MDEKEKLSVNTEDLDQLPPWLPHQLSCLFVMAKKQLPKNASFIEILQKMADITRNFYKTGI